MSYRLLAAVALAIVSIAPSARAEEAELQHRKKRTPRVAKKKIAVRDQLRKLRHRQGLLRASAAKLRALSRESRPKSLPARDKKTWPRFIRFVGSASARMSRTAVLWKKKLDAFEKRHPDLEKARDEMDRLSKSFALQYLQLQQIMQQQNRQFSMMSNIMKTKHETAKNAIDNIR